MASQRCVAPGPGRAEGVIDAGHWTLIQWEERGGVLHETAFVDCADLYGLASAKCRNTISHCECQRRDQEDEQ